MSPNGLIRPVDVDLLEAVPCESRTRKQRPAQPLPPHLKADFMHQSLGFHAPKNVEVYGAQRMSLGISWLRAL